MKTVAALYDVHGNAPALSAVLAEVVQRDVEAIVVGGDVFPGPLGPRCLQMLGELSMPVHYLRGNGDFDTLEASRGGAIARVPEAFKDTIRWCAADAGAAVRAIDAWPLTVECHIDGLGDVLFCHATPGDDNTIFTERTPEFRVQSHFTGVHADLVVCGHTHMAFDRVVGRLRIVNPGSVGMPFGEPGAYWALFSQEGVEFMRTRYDYAAAYRAFTATDYPMTMDPAAPPTADSMIAAFEAREGEAS